MLVPDHNPALEERRIGVRLEQVDLFSEEEQQDECH
jgi:hypothetical protein